MKRCLLAGLVVIVLCRVSVPIGTSGAEAAEKGDEEPRPTHVEVESIGGSDELKFGSLAAFCLGERDNLLVCDRKAQQVKVVSPGGRLLDRWDVPFPPSRIRRAPDGDVYLGGPGVLALLDDGGRVIKSITSDHDAIPKARVSGIAATERHVFASFGSGWSLRSRDDIVRLDRDLENPAVIARNLRGCCQRLDLAAREGVLYVAENARYRVLRLDRDGNVLSKWGKRSRTEVEGFGSCCNPMNITFGPDGALYTAESGLGRVKRYSPKGEFLGLVGEVGVRRFRRAGRVAASCSNITVAVSSDSTYVYVQDVEKNLIRVLRLKQSD